MTDAAPNTDPLSGLRDIIRDWHLADEQSVLDHLKTKAAISFNARVNMSDRARNLIEDIRADGQSGLMEVFLTEYGLSTDEGIALMCLAEALLRVPDAETIDELIEDKIAPSSWGQHLGRSSSSLVNASTWALMLTGKVLDDDASSGMAHILHGAVKRLGEPVIRIAVKAAMKELGNQFVLGETVGEALRRGAAMEARGYTYSYDMLGEAALTAHDAGQYFAAYQNAIRMIGQRATLQDIRANPGISIKLSALHPRFEFSQKSRVMAELTERALSLALLAKEANMGLNIDAEEAGRLDLSLDIIEAVLSDPRLAGWNGFGVVVQAYGRRAAPVIDWLYALAQNLDRRIMVRLVKGAYWDSEIKRAQVDGIADFPVFTRKAATDVSYICCAKKLLGMSDRIFPQFATHNAHTVSAILELAGDNAEFEFQRLHGMGEALHHKVQVAEGTRCRIYAPVGAHRDLLAYLVRRLLENGANSSFVNQIVDASVPAEKAAADPFAVLDRELELPVPHIRKPAALFEPERCNSKGWDLQNTDDCAEIDAARTPFRAIQWHAGPLMAAAFTGTRSKPVFNPANPSEQIGTVVEANAHDVGIAMDAARDWRDMAAESRAGVLNRAASLYEQHFGEIFAALIREAGKTPLDAVAELREAVDFLRYYASQAGAHAQDPPRGLFACISPWNFPLAIFTGQIAAALAVGNGVLAKPADTTPITAFIAVNLLHKAGVPRRVLQLLPGAGPVVGTALSADPRIEGVCFTGSTRTAQTINRAMAAHLAPNAPLIAETGGINAMVVDSTALPEQAVRDIVTSAFRSAGQRCSALRLLYLQDDIEADFLSMLFGAMEELRLADPWDYETDIGPVIDATARQTIADHIETAQAEGRLLKQLEAPKDGIFIGPAVIRVGGMQDMQREIFGPVLHVASFKVQDIGQIIADINASGYGLTFGLHTRIDDRVETITTGLNVGNIYVNRNQIGAVVGSQPFGGEGLSGTGPKAGGPHYLAQFTRHPAPSGNNAAISEPVAITQVQAALDVLHRITRTPLETTDLPGPTGESNRLSTYPRGTILCLGPTAEHATKQAGIAHQNGCNALIVCPGSRGPACISGYLEREHLTNLTGFGAAVLWSDEDDLRQARLALSLRDGPIIPLIANTDMANRCIIERHVCVDTTASGGNSSLLAAGGR